MPSKDPRKHDLERKRQYDAQLQRVMDAAMLLSVAGKRMRLIG